MALKNFFKCIAAPFLLSFIPLGVFGQAQHNKDLKDTTLLQEVVLSAPMIKSTLLKTPFSISYLNASSIQKTTPQSSLKEYLGQVPGLFVQNQYNFNQDLRISIRGFGARAAFGIRGVHLNIDGIPETTPDGQGQIDNIPLGILETIEVLRGPSSALYGNAAGGVILMKTIKDLGPNKIKFRAMGGAFGWASSQLSLALGKEKFKSLWHLNHSTAEGYRNQSGFKQNQINATFSYEISEKHELNGQLNFTDSPYANDPGSLTIEQATANRKEARLANIRYKTSEKINHFKLGFSHSYKPLRDILGPQEKKSMEVNSYSFFAKRGFEGLLPFENGGLSAFDRQYYGLGTKASLNHQKIGALVFGVGYAHQNDLRSRFQNEAGVIGALNAQQREKFSNFHGFIHAKKTLENWQLSASLRGDLIAIEIEESAQKRNLSAYNPSISLGRTISDTHFISLSYTESFETPTLSELSNAPDGSLGFNTSLSPVKAQNLELIYRGSALNSNRKIDWELAGFISQTDGEILPYELAAFPQRQFFKNVGATDRKGLEATFTLTTNTIEWRNSASLAHYTFDLKENEGGLDGKRLPGIPTQHFQSQLQIKLASDIQLRLEFQHVGSLMANNNNSVSVAPYQLLNLFGAKSFSFKGGVIDYFAGINNLSNSKYFDNIRINAFGARYYEPAPTRHLFMGLEISLL